MGKSHGCHPNHEKALAQMRALYSAEGKSFDFFGEDESLKVLTQKRGKESRPASQFLVVGDKDKPDTWNLPTHQGGKLSPRLLGAAHAALTVGYRGQKYSGPGKEEAILKLKRLATSLPISTLFMYTKRASALFYDPGHNSTL